MTAPLSTQIRDYFEYVDEKQGPVDTSALERRRDAKPLLELPATGLPRRRPLIALAAAAAVALVIVLISSRRDSADDVNIVDNDLPAPAPSVSIGPGAWSVAATLPAGSASPDQLTAAADELRSWPGVIEVAIAPDADTWRALTGLECGAGGVVPRCGGGVVALVVNTQMAQAALRLESELGMEALTPDDIPQAFVAGYLDAALEVASPVPLRFDPSPLGAELTLTGPIVGYHPEFCAGLSCDVVVVELDGEGFTFRASLDREDTGGVSLSGGAGAGFAFDDLLIDQSGQGGVVALFGLENPVGPLSEPNFHVLAGLPLEAAVVVFDRGDGTTVWQRPLAGMAILAEGSRLPGTPVPPLVVLDSDGVEIMRIGGPATPIARQVTDLRIDPALLTSTPEPGSAAADAAATPPRIDLISIDGGIRSFEPFGRLLIAETADAIWVGTGRGTIDRVDAATRDITDSIPVHGDVAHLVASIDGLWAVVPETRTVLRIDLATRRVTDEIELPGPASYLGDATIADGGMWLSHGDTNGFTRIDLVTHVVEFHRHPGLPTDGAWVGAGDQELWSGLDRFDLATFELERHEVDFDFDWWWPDPSSTVWAEDAIWLVNSGGDIARFDLDSRQITHRLGVGGGLSGATFSDGALWLSNSGRGTITRIDAAASEVTDVIVVDPGAGPLVVADDGALWVAHPESGSVSRIDARTRRVTDVVDVDIGSDHAQLLDVDGSVWVASENGTIAGIETR